MGSYKFLFKPFQAQKRRELKERRQNLNENVNRALSLANFETKAQGLFWKIQEGSRVAISLRKSDNKN